MCPAINLPKNGELIEMLYIYIYIYNSSIKMELGIVIGRIVLREPSPNLRNLKLKEKGNVIVKRESLF
jgi:hypothetical protein